MFGCTWKMTKNIFGSDRWCFFGVSKKTILTVTFNMLLHDGKTFFRSQKYHKLIYLWGSMALKLCLIVHEKFLKYILGVIGDVSLLFQKTVVKYVIECWKIIF